MKRKLIAVSSALALMIAAYAGVSFYAGARLKTESDRAIDILNAHLSRKWSDQVQITQTNYVRGIFSSEGTYVLTFPSSKDPSIRPEIIFTNEIQHGPFPVLEVMRGNLRPLMASIHTIIQENPYTQALFTANAGKSFLNGHTIIDLKGVSTLDWSAVALDYTQEATRSKFGGATLQATIGADFSTSLGELKIASLNISDGKSSVDMQGGSIHTNTRIGSFDLNIGASGVTIDSLTIATLDKPSLIAKKISSQMTLNEKASVLDGQLIYNIGALEINQKDWGKISLTAAYDKLDGTALKSLVDLNNSLMTRSLTNPVEADLITTSDLKQFWLGIQSLLKGNPSIRIEPFSWQTSDGESSFSLKAAFAATNTPPNGMGLSSNPVSALEATLRISRPMLAGLMSQFMQNHGTSSAQAKTRTDKEIKSMLDAAQQKKIGKLEGDTFVSQLSFEKNVLKINDHTLPLETITSYITSMIPSAWMFEESSSAQDRPDETAEIQHLDPSALATILTAADFNFEETRDDQGDPILKVNPGTSGAAKIDFSFIGCGTDPTCEDVLLRATYSPDKPVALKVANDWNLRNRWARAYVNEKNEAVIEMDINAYGGIGHDALEAMVNTFFKIVGDFSKELGNKK